MIHHGRPDRIELDIAVAGHGVLVSRHQAGMEAPLPQAAGAALLGIDAFRVTLRQVLHQ